MNISISANNRIEYVPDVGNNLDLPEDKRFVMVFRKVNKFAATSKAMRTRVNGDQPDKSVSVVDNVEFIRTAFVEMRNPPILDYGETKRDMTFDDIFDVDIPELGDLAKGVFAFATKLVKDGDAEIKKS